MMNYYGIEISLNEKIMGTLPQVKEVIHNCHTENEPAFIDRYPYIKIEHKPVLSVAHLYAKSNLTDIIKVASTGFSFGSFLISERFKSILEQYNCYGVQFFPTHIIKRNQRIDNYWQTHICKIPYEYMDFKNTDVLLKDRDVNRKVTKRHLERTTKEGFLEMVKSMKYPKMIFLKNTSFKDNMNLDYFHLRYAEGNSSGVVSERLKDEIERQEITGIEFRPFNLTLQEWYHSGEREKVYGKS